MKRTRTFGVVTALLAALASSPSPAAAAPSSELRYVIEPIHCAVSAGAPACSGSATVSAPSIAQTFTIRSDTPRNGEGSLGTGVGFPGYGDHRTRKARAVITVKKATVEAEGNDYSGWIYMEWCGGCGEGNMPRELIPSGTTERQYVLEFLAYDGFGAGVRFVTGGSPGFSCDQYIDDVFFGPSSTAYAECEARRGPGFVTATLEVVVNSFTLH